MGVNLETTVMSPDPEVQKNLDFELVLSEWCASPWNTSGDSSRKPIQSRALNDWLVSEGAQRVIDRLQLEVDSEPESSLKFHRLGLLRYLSKIFQILPISLIIQEARREGSNPVAGGGFADIWRGRLNEKPVCLKVLRFAVEQDENTRVQMRKQFCREALVWRQLKHPNILPLLGVNTELFFPSFCLVSPWMEHRDIITYLKKNPKHDVLSVFLDVVAGICYLHSRDPPVIHGDIRGGNILVTDDHRCCLADFGLTLVSTHSETWSVATSSATTKGSMRWLAPEYISLSESLPNHTSRDVYAFGCTIIETITQKPPFNELKNDASVLLGLMSGARPARPENVWCPDEIWNLATHCWAQNKQERPSANEIFDILAGLGGTTFTQEFRIVDNTATADGGSSSSLSPKATFEHLLDKKDRTEKESSASTPNGETGQQSPQCSASSSTTLPWPIRRGSKDELESSKQLPSPPSRPNPQKSMSDSSLMTRIVLTHDGDTNEEHSGETSGEHGEDISEETTSAAIHAPVWLLNTSTALKFLWDEHPKAISTLSSILITAGSIPAIPAISARAGSARRTAQAVGDIAVGAGNWLRAAQQSEETMTTIPRAPDWFSNAGSALDSFSDKHPKVLSVLSVTLITVGSISTTPPLNAAVGDTLLASGAAKTVGAIALGVGCLMRLAERKTGL